MSGCKGIHCGGCGDGNGLPALALVIVAVLVIAAVAKAVAAAFHEAVHVLAVALEVLFIAFASVAGVTALAGLTWAGVKVYRRCAVRAAAAAPRPPDQPVRVTAEVVRPEPLAIEAPKSRLHVVPGIPQEASRDPR